MSPEQRDNLQTGRDAIREKIQSYFSEELEVKEPAFYLQGSYGLKTMIRPLGTDDYDLDDGVYLQHTSDDISTPTAETAGNWIIKAVDGHVKSMPERLKNCVRVVYAKGYHIDLPVYREIGGKVYLATLEGNRWIPSDARAFNGWFHERLEASEQMRDCIKYLKAWKDFQGCDLEGIHVTVLVGLNHVPVRDRDDESVAQTVDRMRAYLEDKRAIANPIDDDENLLAGWSDSKVRETIRNLEWFSEKASSALGLTDKGDAAREWQVLFGDRFPITCSDERKNSRASPAGPLIVIARDPKPHCADFL